MKNIIVLEDNKDINELLTGMLTLQGYTVFSAFNAFDALEFFADNKIDCILTDLMLPVMSGENFIQEIRKNSNVHIIAISAKGRIDDKIEVLKLGADDYLVKPFVEEEVILKIKNLFNKIDINNTSISINDSQLVFSYGVNELIIGDEKIKLTAVEYYMVKHLFDNINRVISRESFMNVLYSLDKDVTDRVIDVHIRNIRKKMSEISSHQYISTVYGLGYKLEGEVDE